MLAKAVGQATWLRLIQRVRQQAGSYREIAFCQATSMYEQNRIRGQARSYACGRGSNAGPSRSTQGNCVLEHPGLEELACRRTQRVRRHSGA